MAALSRAELEAALSASFSQDVSWPIDHASLTALIDLGFSNAEIARYFAVEPDDVYMLRDRYGLIGSRADGRKGTCR